MTDLSAELERFLTSHQLMVLRRSADVADLHGVSLYLVGGSVRDLLLGVRPGDLDLVGVGIRPSLASELAQVLDGRVVARSQFGTSRIETAKIRMDLAMARSETYSKPGALPRISPAECIREDLERRDFSINAMALELSEGRWASLVDPLSGEEDLHRKKIRVLHGESFRDDATRIFRAVRYAVRMGFTLDKTTEKSLLSNLNFVDTLSADRVRNELEAMFLEGRALSVVRRAGKLGLLDAVVPGLTMPLVTVGALPQGDTRINRLWALLVWSMLPTPGVGKVKERLRLSRTTSRVLRDVGSIKRQLSELQVTDLSPSELYNMLSGLEPESVKAATIACRNKEISQLLEHYLSELRNMKSILNGDDLLCLGVSRGPEIGEMLQKLLNARLDAILKTREDEEQFVRRQLEL